MSLAAALAARAGGPAAEVLAAQEPGGAVVRLSAGALAGAVWAGPAAGAALSLRSVPALLRLLAALDGRAARVLLLAPGLPGPAVAALMRAAGLTLIVTDRAGLGAEPELAGLAVRDPAAALAGADAAPSAPAAPGVETEWVLTTSGTTGLPKMVRHRLAGLARAVRPPPAGGTVPAWGLFYEPTRFAGLQVVLQALLGGGRLVAPETEAPMAARLAFLAAGGATHLSATPSLWRRILMEPAASGLAPAQITLGGEIADAAVLAALAARWPGARLRHIYASTELGVGFSVGDGLPGFPAAWLDAPPGAVALRIRDGMLWLRPPGEPPAYLGRDALAADPDGFLPTGDRVRREGGRVLFLGRESSAVNIGGAKIQPEEIEHILLGHPAIAAARIEARPSPITGHLLSLTVVPADPGADPAALRREIARFCRERLPREAMPARIALAAEPAVTAAGKTPRS